MSCCQIQVLSRPLLEQYYMDAYDAVRKHSSDCFVVFAPRQWETDGLEWNTFMSGSPYTKTLQDIHRCGWSSFVRMQSSSKTTGIMGTHQVKHQLCIGLLPLGSCPLRSGAFRPNPCHSAHTCLLAAAVRLFAVCVQQTADELRTAETAFCWRRAYESKRSCYRHT